MRSQAKFMRIAALVAVSVAALAAGRTAEKKAARLEGEYRIFSSGRQIGLEKYVLITSEDAITSSSTLDLRNPSGAQQKMTLDTKLVMDGNYVPQSYELTSEVDSKKGSIRGNFAPNQAIFEYSGGGVSYRNGLLVGERYTILDTNVFHHFIFLARLFKYDSGTGAQTFEVLIPQDKETGSLQINDVGKEIIAVNGKKYSTTHLVLDSGSLKIQMWVDGERIPRKIAVPDKKIEVLHGN